MAHGPWSVIVYGQFASEHRGKTIFKYYSKITRKEEIIQLGGGVGRNKINATDQLLELRLVFKNFNNFSFQKFFSVRN